MFDTEGGVEVNDAKSSSVISETSDIWIAFSLSELNKGAPNIAIPISTTCAKPDILTPASTMIS